MSGIIATNVAAGMTIVLRAFICGLDLMILKAGFGWQNTRPDAAPTWVLPSRRCSSSNWRRGVGVEWEDYEGNHGYEWAAY